LGCRSLRETGAPFHGMRKPPDTQALAVLAVSALAVLAALETARLLQPDPLREEKAAAVALMRRASDAVREAKLRAGIPVDRRLDPNGTGLIGVEYTDITTTLGSLVAKRTSTNPAFAAVVVDMLGRAGVRRGDRVAIGFSGSFPALNIAVLSAASALELRPVIVSSVGASSYGANQPEMTWLDMERVLAEEGIFPWRSTAASLGGVTDTCGGLDGTGIAAGLGAIRRNGIPLIEENGSATLEADVRNRMALYDRSFGGARPSAFINVGGSATSIGDGLEAHRIPTGLLKKVPRVRRPERGIIYLMGERGVPVIHLLEIKSIAARYGIPVDASPLPAGTSATFPVPGRYSPPLAAGGLTFLIAVLAFRKKAGTGRVEDPSASVSG